MADIARMAGVSTATVSRALSGSTLVNDETRLRIAELAKSLNYTVNVGAKNLRSGQNRTIAVVIPYEANKRQTLTDPFFLSMIGTLATVLTEKNYEMLLCRISEDDMQSIGELYTAGRAAGIVVIGQWHHHDDLNELASRRVPLVVWGAQQSQQLYCSVGSDNIQGGYLATQHLLQLGCRKILFLGDTSLPEARARYQGYVNAHVETGFEVLPHLCVPVSFEPNLARQALGERFKQGLNCDGVFASSDLIAVTAMSLLAELGYRIPFDVPVIGFDDIDMAQFYRPSLSTIRQPLDAAGPEILRLLEQQIRGEGVRPSQLSTRLVIRESTDLSIQHAARAQ